MALARAVGVREDELPWVDIGVRPGYNQRYQGFFDKARGVAARIGSLYAEPYYHSPRHRHTFQQVRYVCSGKMQYGKETYGVGDCLYLPEGAYYGPIKPVTEAGGEQLHFVDIQFEGPSGIPYPEPEEVVDAQRALAAIGKFEEGIYTFPDGRKRDAYEAILEKITGQRIEYPRSRLADYVVMRTALYPWLPHRDLVGVAQKHLGYFFESGPNLKLVKLSAGRALPAVPPQGHRAVFLLKGELEFDAQQFAPLSYFMLPDATPTAEFRARGEVEMLLIGWANPGATVPFEMI
jgi:hypothetical protein